MRLYVFFVLLSVFLLSACDSNQAPQETAYVSLTFHAEGGSEIASRHDIPYGISTSLPIPSKEHHQFLGWFRISNNEELEVNHETSITGDWVLYARWIAHSYDVQFLDYDGHVILTQSVEHGQHAIPPQQPSREGYAFIGWDVPFENITKPITIQAVYERLHYTVSFETHGGGIISDVEHVPYGTTISIPEVEKENHRFVGWFIDLENLSEPFTIDTSVTSDLTLHALWENMEGVYFDVSFYDKDNEVIETIAIGYNGSISLEDTPYQSFFRFISWDKPLNNITTSLDVHPLVLSDDNTVAIRQQHLYHRISNVPILNPDFNRLNFPIGLGLPQLTPEEIDALVGQPVEVLRDSINTVVDLYAYLIAAQFNVNYHSSVDSIQNWYYSNEHDLSFFIFESAELALAFNRAGCAGLANIVHYILEDNYDHIGFLWWYHTEEGGHSFNYIEHEGLTYMVDMTQLRGITQPRIDWFNLSHFPVIHEHVDDFVAMNIRFRLQNQNNETQFYARFTNHNMYIPHPPHMRYWDLENVHFYLYHEAYGEPVNSWVSFETNRDLLNALNLSEADFWFPDIINLDE